MNALFSIFSHGSTTNTVLNFKVHSCCSSLEWVPADLLVFISIVQLYIYVQVMLSVLPIKYSCPILSLLAEIFRWSGTVASGNWWFIVKACMCKTTLSITRSRLSQRRLYGLSRNSAKYASDHYGHVALICCQHRAHYIFNNPPTAQIVISC